jgi:hypothetical protein
MKRRVVRGTVARRPYAVGSKSEHEAVMLITDEGEFRLQLKGGNPFRDPALDALVGKRIEAEGVVAGPTFVLERRLGEEQLDA